MAKPIVTLSEEEIRRLYHETFEPQLGQGASGQWQDAYVGMVRRVADAKGHLGSVEMQRLLWEDNGVSGAGMCSVKLGPAIEKAEFRDGVAALLGAEIPVESGAATATLQKIYEGLIALCQTYTTRMPWVKIIRVLAAVYPRHISCVIDISKLKALARGILPDLRTGDLQNTIALHLRVLARIDASLGRPCPTALEELVRRSMFTWHVYATIKRRDDVEDGEPESGKPGEEIPSLKFLPQQRRLAGVPAISGYLGTALKILGACAEGATRAEAAQFVRQQFPNLQKSSANQYVGIARSHLGLLTLDGDVLRPSPLGQRCLDSADEDVAALLIPRFLSLVIGPDWVLRQVADKGATSGSDLRKGLQTHYPRWTSEFGPSALLSWCSALGLVEQDVSKKYVLTDSGKYWVQAVPRHLAPVTTVPHDELEHADHDEDETPVSPDVFSPPTLTEILDVFRQLPYVFPDAVIARLHLALHAHDQKHFVLLSGLSGTGKTKVALAGHLFDARLGHTVFNWVWLHRRRIHTRVGRHPSIHG